MNKPLTYPYRLDPETIAVLHARARRARSQAIHSAALKFVNWVASRFSTSGHPFGVKWG